METIKSYLSFIIGKEHFALSVEYIQSINEYSELTRIPNMPPYLIGILNLRGEGLPIIDSRIKLGMVKNDITTNACIIVIECTINNKNTKFGLLVDAVSEVLEITDSEIKNPPEIGTKYNTNLINGIYSIEDRFLMLLNIDNLLDKDEALEISAA